MLAYLGCLFLGAGLSILIYDRFQTAGLREIEAERERLHRAIRRANLAQQRGLNDQVVER